MKTDIRILLVPGGGGSGVGHWDHSWEEHDPRVQRVIQPDWNAGTRQQWVACMDQHIAMSTQPTFLVAHSLGCIAVAHWLGQYRPVVRGALLVAPADVEDDWAPEGSLYQQFSPIPAERFPIVSTVVASTNDPYLSIERAEELAEQWGANIRRIGKAGHIGSDSGLADWGAGRQILEELIQAGNPEY